MNRNNPVTRILVTKGNLTVLAAGSTPDALAPGQIGVFSYDTNLSLSSATVAGVRNFYIAVGIDRNGDGVTDDIATSAGTHIQRYNIIQPALRCYTPGRLKIIDITNFKVKCDTDYGIRIGIANGEAYSNYGFNTPSKTYMVHSNCCTDDCAACPEGDCNNVAKQMVDEINNDPEKIVTAQFIDYTTTPGTNIVVAAADFDDWVADTDNEGKCLGIRITGNTQSTKPYVDYNWNYETIRGTNIQANLIEGFECNGKVTVFQELGYEQGAGYDLAWEEYANSGYAGSGNYRQSELLGKIFSYDQFADRAGKYLTVSYHNDLTSESGRATYANPECTVVGIPCADTTTRAAFFTLMDALLSNFEPMSNDASACADCTTVNTTSGRALNADGLVDGGDSN